MESRKNDGYPEKNLLKKLYLSLSKDLTKTIPRNLANPHNDEVHLPGIPRLIFSGVFSKLFLPEENTRKITTNAKTSPLFEINTL